MLPAGSQSYDLLIVEILETITVVCTFFPTNNQCSRRLGKIGSEMAFTT